MRVFSRPTHRSSKFKRRDFPGGYVKESHDVESWDNLDGAHKVRLCLRDFGQELVP